MQRFKPNDLIEDKILDAVQPVFELVGGDLDDFYEGAYTTFPLGDVLYDSGRDPTIGPTSQQVFRSVYFSIHELFTRPGPFEFYIQLFQALWGSSVSLTFSIPGPGKLHIDVIANEIELEEWRFRVIEDMVYVKGPIVDHTDDPLVFKVKKGIKTQEELDALLREIVPQGIYVTSTLTVV